MRKLIYILLFIPFIGFGQDIKQIPKGAINNSRATGRINETINQVNATVDTTVEIREDVQTITDTTEALRASIQVVTDTAEALREDIDTNIDNITLSKSVFDWDDSTAVLTIITSDSGAFDAITYTNTYWEDLRVPMSNTKLNPTKSEPALEEIVTGVLAYAFEADADSSERLNFIAQLPHSRKAGTDLECHLHWSPSTTNTGNCYWRFTYTIVSIDGTFGAATSFRVADAGDGTALKHQLVNLGTIDGANLGISSVLIGNITRLGESPTDSFTGVAYGLEFDIHYEISSPGSEEETIKY